MAEPDLISIVDDDESVRQALDALLRAAGLRVRSFASAEAFLLSEAAPATSCLILDLRLPGMTGLTLQHWLVRQQLRLPVIVLSGHGDDQSRARALSSGAVEFFSKPVDAEVLLRAVASVVAGAEPRLS
jgi:two-component system, LuxR family, response regulator FixJ